MAKSPLGKAIERAYGGTRVSLDVLMAEIQAQAGSGRKAAKLVGVGETTWRRWRSGATNPRPENLSKAENAVRAVRADKKPFNAAKVEIKTKNAERERTITGRQLGMTSSGAAAVDAAYAAGGGDAAARAFVQAVTDDFYRDYLEGNEYEGHEPPDGDYFGVVGSVSW